MSVLNASVTRRDPRGWGIPFTVDPRHYNATGTFNTANDCYYNRVTGGGSISKMRLFVNVASGNISVAVHRNSGVGVNAVPGTQLATTGSIVCPSGVVDIALGSTVEVRDGDWFALSCDNLTAKFGFAASGQLAALGNLTFGFAVYQPSAHPCPATPASLQGLSSKLLMVGVP